MNWRIDVLNQSVVEEIDALPPDMRAKLDHIIRMIEELGLYQVREPYIKALRGKLWEIRIKGRDGIARVIYVTVKERRIVILHAFRKKTRKTPEAAIRTALSRMKELEP